MKASLALPPSIAGKKFDAKPKDSAPIKKPQAFAALGGLREATTPSNIDKPANLGDLSVKDIKKSPNLMNAEIKKPLPKAFDFANPLAQKPSQEEVKDGDNKPLQKRFAALRDLDNDSDEEEARKAREAFKLKEQKKK